MESDYDVLRIWTYSIVGTLFIFYFFAVFLQRKVDNKIRVLLSALFLATGIFFFIAAGQLISQDENLISIGMITSIILALIGLAFVYVLYCQGYKNKKLEELEKQKDCDDEPK